MELFLTMKLSLNLTELWEIELIICIKMDLALNNLQWLIFHKTQPTNFRGDWGNYVIIIDGNI